ncbi:DUF4405 domain-containing protein [Chlorobium ferrooxidans]|uniref:Flavinylation-associated cytochrome domain-containing protein n=1 Tax=Chlorobium ferrooxidans DSM 13031 TaxID=377431 RepID=Q0YU20_9CHLB|nr:DUF4405 domain-containing protein [Chlorobium ferrooxidans]EAT59734.1 hypothetical protein CferDRAFT_1741 [Chlorobium ferrooxidans DSM 13031]
MSSMKSWATPLATGTFIILAITGILMFFKIETGFIGPVHEWLSWALIAGVLLHIAANWKSFTGYLSRKPALAIIGTGLLVTLISVFAPVEKESNPRMNIIRAVESSSIETVAGVAAEKSETIIAKLESKGITVVKPSMTIREIAAKNSREEKDILGIIFEQPKK